MEEETSSGGKRGMEMEESIRVRKQGNTVRVQLKEISQRPCWREREEINGLTRELQSSWPKQN